MTVKTEIARVIYKRMKQVSFKFDHNESIHDLEILQKMADKASGDVHEWLDEQGYFD